MKTLKAIYVDERLHRRVKLLAVRSGRPLKDIVESLLDGALRERSPDARVSTRDLQGLAARGAASISGRTIARTCTPSTAEVSRDLSDGRLPSHRRTLPSGPLTAPDPASIAPAWAGSGQRRASVVPESG
jgi:hypothetical protein